MPPKDLILIVDDDEDFAGVLRAGLERLGYEVHTADRAAKAKDWLLTHPTVFAVIGDAMMPEGNGLDFLRAVRGHKELKDVPVFICTGLKDPEIMRDALELGAVDFLRKPVPLAVLKEKLDRLRLRRSPQP